MSTTQAVSGEVIDVRPEQASPAEFQLSMLLKTPTLEVRRLVLPKGREIPTHHAAGEITVHCLSGRITFHADGQPRNLEAGQMLFLDPRVPHSLVGLEDATMLVTKLTPQRPANP